jgi:hypothetical protein
MAKTKISEFSSTPGNNTDIDGIDIAEGCAPSNINNAIRELMSQLKNQQAGLDGDTFTTNDVLTVSGVTANAGRVRLGEDADNGTSYTELRSAASLASNVTFVLPSADGAASSLVQTDGSGNLSFQASTGTGNIVRASSPALTTPDLGTPSAVTLTNATGLPIIAGTTGTLTVARGGTGATTAADARTNLGVTETGQDTTYAFRSNNLSDLSSASTARTNLGLGTIATQSAASVSITGGSITGITDLAVADGGTGASSAADARTNLGVTATGQDTTYAYRSNNLSDLSSASTARTNLGLGSIATQAANSVSISGGSITGITDLAVTDGGTGASTAADARTNLGVPSLTGSGATGTWNIDILGSANSATSATTATTATNLAGGAANRIAYQTGSGATSFITAPTSSNTYLSWNGSALTWDAPSGTGDVVGPSGATANQIVLFDGTTGKLVKAASTTGILKASSGVISAAVSGTDYVPTTGTGATGSWGISVTGTAANVASGAANQLVYQTGSNTTSFVTAPTVTDTFLKWNGTAFAWDTASGGVTSVSGTSPVVSSGGSTPAISLASGYGDTQNPYASKTANYVLASPNGSSGAPTFRALVAADIPTLNQNTTGTAASIASGTANQILYQSGASTTTFATAPTVSNTYLKWNGTAFAWDSPSGSGDVVGPSSSVDGQIVLFDSTTGKLIKAATTTGLLKASSGVIAQATSGTDYAPATSGTSILYGNGSGGFSNVTIGTGLSFSTGTLSATGGGGGTTTNALTMNNSGSGAASGTTFDGSTAVTLSYNTLGAAPAPTGTSAELLANNGTGGFSNVTVGSGLSLSAGTLSATGGGAGGPILESQIVISSNVTLTNNTNGLSVSPVTVATGYAVTIPDGQSWMVLG